MPTSDTVYEANDEILDSYDLETSLPERTPLKPKLCHSHSLQHSEATRPQMHKNSNSLPKGLNGPSSMTGPHGVSPLVASRSRISLVRQRTMDTEFGDDASVLFKRTPLDLMKQNASLLTNIICLAITFSLVLVTVVQFSANEQKWERFDLKVNKLSMNTEMHYEETTQQAMSIKDMEHLLYGENNGTSLANLTDIGIGMIQTMAQMKHWYSKNEALLADLTRKSKSLLLTKDTIFGKGSRSGVLDQMQLMKSQIRDVRTELAQQRTLWQNNLVDLKAEVKELFNLHLHTRGNVARVEQRVETQQKEQQTNLTEMDIFITAKLKEIKSKMYYYNETMKETKKKTANMEKVLGIALNNIQRIDSHVNEHETILNATPIA